MDRLGLKTFIFGGLYNNCYLIFDKESKEAFIIDSPAFGEEIFSFIQSQGLKILFIALTHAHFDHIEGLNEFSVPFYVHKDDAPFLKDPNLNGSVFFSGNVVIDKIPNLYQEEKPLYFGEYPIEVIHTPGHSPGSVSLKLNKWLFSGDTIFLNSIGRTDIPLASGDVLIKSIKEKILILPSDTIVYPGHGDSTTVEKEKADNPFL